MEFADKIKLIRVLLGKTQLELAAELGIQQPAVARYEKGGMQPRTALALKYAAALNVSLVWLMNAGGVFRTGMYRPLSPWQTYSPASVKSIKEDLAGIEALAQDIGASSLKFAEAEFGGVLVAAQGSSAFAVLARSEILPALRALKNCGLGWDEFEISKIELLRALINPSKNCYIIFQRAGTNLQLSERLETSMQFQYPQPSPPKLRITLDVTSYNAIAEEEAQKIVESIRDSLRKKFDITASGTWNLSSPHSYDPAFQEVIMNKFGRDFLEKEGLLL